jgi:diguanylate cyclase (GGDEF)-like protein
MQDGKVREAEVFMHHRNGHRVPVRVRGAPLVDESGAVVGAVEVFSENTRNYKAFRTLRRLQSEVLRDALTGIGNRKLADMTLDNLLHGFHTHGVPFGVLLADIDHFKRVNDTWGHGVGDRVLRMVAGTLTSGVRPLDTACRWGGEEFLVLLPGAGEQGLANAAERLRVMIASSWVVEQGERMIVTASFGGTVSRPGDTARTVLDRADATLYRSKQAGRNCTSLDCAQSEQGGGQPI